MAELSIAASILSIAAIGTSLATTLYEQADVLIHARREITSMAKHVSRFTAVLKHTSQVLDAEKENCSKEMLRDIRRIKHSCTKTFKEINSTIESKRSRVLESFKWMFKKAKARELEARLDSLQSMLQCMIHTLTVSKLARMDSRSREDSHQITDLSSEIKLLKTLIIENKSNLEELRLAEQDSEVQDTHDSAKYTHVRTLDGRIPYPQEQKPQVSFKQPRSPRGRSPTSNSLHSESEHSEAEKEEASDLEGKDPEDKTDPRRTDTKARKIINAIQEVSTQPPPPYRGPSQPSIHRESNLLLQMVPYTSRILNPGSPQYLLTATQGPDNDVKSAMQEATSNIRLLLDKWTNPGSAPVADLLAQEAAKNAEREAELRPDSSANAHPAPRQRARTAEDDPYYDSYYNLPDTPTSPYHWLRPSLKRRPLGDEILFFLRSRRAGIVYMKRNKFQLFHYVDNECFYINNLLPPHMMQNGKVQYTELGQGLVKKEALDLLGYSYEQTPSGHLSVVGDLNMFAIEQLVRLSYQALQRTLDVRSERFLESHSRETVHPDFYDQSHKDEDWRPARAGYDDRRPDGLGTQSDTRPHGSRVPPPPLATRMPNRVIYNDLRESRMPGLQATERQGSVQRNFTVAGDRATTGRGTSRGTGNNRTKRQHRPEPATTTSDEIDRALDRLALLRTREAESEKANDSQRVADLRNYAIPDQEKIISELRKKLNDHRGDKFRHPEVDTESESSDRDDLPATNGVEVLEEID